MCKFRDQVEDSKYYLDRYSPKGSCHLVETTWVTHLLRKVFSNWGVECITRAQAIQFTWQGWESVDWKLILDDGLKCSNKDPNKIDTKNKLVDRFQIAKSVQKLNSPKYSDVPVLGLAGCHRRQIGNCRYAWLDGSGPCYHPLQN